MPRSASTPPPRGMRHRAARGLFWSTVRLGGNQITQVLVFLVLARLLDPRDFGLVALAVVFVSIIDALVDQGFGAAIVQREQLEDGHLDAAFAVSLTLAAVCVAAMFVAAPWIAAWLDAPALTSLLRVLSLSFVFVALRSVQVAQLRRALDFRALAFRDAIAVTTAGAVGIGMAVAGFGVWSLVGQQVTREATALLVLWTASAWRPGRRGSWRHVRELWSYSVNLTGTQLLGLANRRVADLLIGRFLGTTALGFYAVGQRLVQAFTRLTVLSVSQVALPTFARFQGDPERIRRGLYTATMFTGMVGFPVFAGLALMAPEIVPAWFGERWIPAVPVMQFLAIVGFSASVGGFNGAVLQAVGHARSQFRLSVLGIVATLTAILIAVPYGIVAVAAALAIRALAFAPVSAWVTRRHLQWDTRRYIGQFVAPFLATAVMAGVVLGVRGYGDQWPQGVRIAVAIALATVAYAATLWYLTPDAVRRFVESFRSAVPGLERGGRARDVPPGPPPLTDADPY